MNALLALSYVGHFVTVVSIPKKKLGLVCHSYYPCALKYYINYTTCFSDCNCYHVLILVKVEEELQERRRLKSIPLGPDLIFKLYLGLGATALFRFYGHMGGLGLGRPWLIGLWDRWSSPY
jgi:hypothetical protein